MKIFIKAALLIVFFVQLGSQNMPSQGSAFTFCTATDIKDTALYMSIGNPDTALAFFLYKDCYHYDHDLQKEEYIRWDREKDTLINLYKALFGSCPDYAARLEQVNANAMTFLKDTRSEVSMNYKTYKAVSDNMETDFLYEKRDPVLKEILNTLILDTAADDMERASAKKLLSNW